MLNPCTSLHHRRGHHPTPVWYFLEFGKMREKQAVSTIILNLLLLGYASARKETTVTEYTDPVYNYKTVFSNAEKFDHFKIDAHEIKHRHGL